VVLRAAGRLEWTGELPAGFVVEGESPFNLACAGFENVEARDREEQRYVTALVAAGYGVEAEPDGHGLLVERAS
jgi:hypothetical protein